jgi:hypothetical protein
MKITLQGTYRRKNDGKIMYRYTVSGSESELALYKVIQGNNFREDEESGKMLYFTSDPMVGNVAELAFNRENTNVYVKNDERLKMESLAQFYKVDMAQAMGNFIAQSMFQQVVGSSAPVAMPAPAPQPVQATQPAQIIDDADPFTDED